MNRKAVSGIMLTTLLIAMLSLAFDIKPAKAIGTIYCVGNTHPGYVIEFEGSSFNGYTLFAPMRSTTTYLINNGGEVVYTWPSDYTPGLSVYLLENGHLLRTAQAGGAGRVQEIEWNGTVTWDFECSSDQHRRHHDIEALPNGNVLMIAWETKTAAEAIAAGLDPNLLPPEGELWPDHIIEVEPTGATGGNIVWEWHVWDHLIQDYDSNKENYGVVADHPELVDINFVDARVDWNHMNSIDYNEEFDQILLSVNTFSEIWVIDHSTTTEEAAGHTGGNSGKGGDILYRWGNPQAYRAGDESDRKFFKQHDAQWIESGCPGEGNILVFNNGRNRPDGSYSSVDEIVPPVDENGNYSLTPGSAYEPEEQIWIYTAENRRDFYSPNISGAQRLPNGNTLICSGDNGYFFEVTREKETVWEYVNPFPDMEHNRVFKVRRYAPDFPGCVHACMAVTNVMPSKTVVGQGYNMSINVTIQNQGSFPETSNVTAYYGNSTIAPGQWETFWSMGDVNRDGYINETDRDIIEAAYGSTPGDPDWCPWADLDQDGDVDLDDLLTVSLNYGLDIWTYFISGAVIETQTVNNLPPATSTTLLFTWNTTGVAKGNYTISAYAVPILCEEVDRSDNNYGDGAVKVTIAGDVDGDYDVDRYDFGIFGGAYGSKPGDANWNPNTDIDSDDDVDRYDFGIFGANYGKTV